MIHVLQMLANKKLHTKKTNQKDWKGECSFFEKRGRKKKGKNFLATAAETSFDLATGDRPKNEKN